MQVVDPKTKNVPIRYFMNDHLHPDPLAIEQLDELSKLPGVEEYIVVLPDVHSKCRNPTPTGTVVVTRDCIIPQAVDKGMNCGMRAMTTGIPAAELKENFFDTLFHQLMDTIPFRQHHHPLLSKEECRQVLLHGLEKLVQYKNLPIDEISRTENGGHYPLDVSEEEMQIVVTDKAIEKGIATLGTVGGGNHFLEMQEITQILNPTIAQKLGLELGHCVFMLHTGSRGLGKRILVHPEAWSRIL